MILKFQIGSTLNLRKCGEEDKGIAASIGPNNTKYCENSCLQNASGNTMYPQNASFRRAPWLTRAACVHRHLSLLLLQLPPQRKVRATWLLFLKPGLADAHCLGASPAGS